MNSIKVKTNCKKNVRYRCGGEYADDYKIYHYLRRDDGISVDISINVKDWNVGMYLVKYRDTVFLKQKRSDTIRYYILGVFIRRCWQ